MGCSVGRRSFLSAQCGASSDGGVNLGDVFGYVVSGLAGRAELVCRWSGAQSNEGIPAEILFSAGKGVDRLGGENADCGKPCIFGMGDHPGVIPADNRDVSGDTHQSGGAGRRMTRALAVVAALLLAALVWQSWRLNNASHTIDSQTEALKGNATELSKKNSQLIALSILTETNNRAQMQLYAEAEDNNALLRQRQRRIEELKRENTELRRWSDTPLPPDVARLYARPAVTGGAAYRQWLSESDALPAGNVSAAH